MKYEGDEKRIETTRWGKLRIKETGKLRQLFEKSKKLRRRRKNARAKKTQEAYKKENNMWWRKISWRRLTM